VGSPCRGPLATIRFVGFLNFIIKSFYEPMTNPDRYVICLCVVKSDIIHQCEDLVKKNSLMTIRQAKKTPPQGAV